ncbi:hypothetical protein [Halomonas getboli]|uniref:hypothetical protein n=1 Tax=Halomonas getboli TaxID=2935862 RepID=UPI001FFE57CA|nr:hypothetical protein [Halomonas getboli]MCK2183502.1 hypothetical protein [Halomonas getboli]
MKIIGGSFGPSGKAQLRNGKLEVMGLKNAKYGPDEVESVNVRQEVNRRFGVIGAIFGGLILAFLFGLFMGPFGWLVGFGLAIAGSFYSDKRFIADLEMTDGASLTLQPDRKAARQLVYLKDNGSS